MPFLPPNQQRQSTEGTRRWTCRRLIHWSLWCKVSAMPNLRLPSQPQGISAPWPTVNYTAWWEGHMHVNNLPKVKSGTVASVFSRMSDGLTYTPGHTQTDWHKKEIFLVFRTCNYIDCYEMTIYPAHCATRKHVIIYSNVFKTQYKHTEINMNPHSRQLDSKHFKNSIWDKKNTYRWKCTLYSNWVIECEKKSSICKVTEKNEQMELFF